MAIEDLLTKMSKFNVYRSERHCPIYLPVFIGNRLITLFWLSSGRKPYTLFHATPRNIIVAHSIQAHKDLIRPFRALGRASKEIAAIVSQYPWVGRTGGAPDLKALKA